VTRKIPLQKNVVSYIYKIIPSHNNQENQFLQIITAIEQY